MRSRRIEHRSSFPTFTWLAVVTAALFASCDEATGPDGVEIEATVEFLAVEGGCWSLRAADGTRYEPLELAEPFREHGLRVVATVRRRADIGTVCQIGDIVEILSIEAVDLPLPPD